MRRAIMVAAGLAGVSGCGGAGVDATAPAAATAAIINGDLCDESVEPSAVAVMIDASVDFGQVEPLAITQAICTGTLIAPDVVMIAAHCLDLSGITFGFGTVEFADFYVTFEADLSRFGGEQSLPIPESAVPVKKGVANPAFNIRALGQGTAGLESDIALLFLEVAITDVGPEVVITTDEASQLAEGSSVRIAGWGQQVDTSSSFEQPPAGSVGIKVCGTSTIEELGDSLMQVGDAAETTRKCHGDSGGPTYLEVTTPSTIKRRVIGVTSRAYDQSDCARGGVDTRVDAFFAWVDDEMRGACSDGTRVWCDVPGVLTADDVATLEGGGVPGEGEGDDIDPIAPGGCNCSGGSADGVGLVGALAALLVGRRRRQR